MIVASPVRNKVTRKARDDYKELGLLIRQYQINKSEDDLKSLVEFFLPVMRQEARRVSRYSHLGTEEDHLVAGLYAIPEIAKKFDGKRDPARFGRTIIRRACISYLRYISKIPPNKLPLIRDIKNFRISFYDRNNITPSREEIVNGLGISLDTLLDLEFLSALNKPMSIGAMKNIGEKLISQDMRIPPNPDPLKQREYFEWIAKKGGLNHREREILRLYYIEEETFKKIGEELGIAESRVSQIHGALINRLKQSLNLEEAESHLQN